MKILATSDLHQAASNWHDLVKICQKDKFDIVAIAGDLFPKDKSITSQASFMPKIIKYANKIKDTGAKLILMLGNDDNQRLIPLMEKAHEDGIFYYIGEKVIEIDGQEFIGMPYVPDYPFGYKFWCRGDSNENIRIDPVQYCDPLLVNDNNEMTTIEDYPAYLKHHKKISEVLQYLSWQVKNINKSIWLIHAPPANLDLDICGRGVKVGSEAILKFIKDNQPLVTIHGHIHEAPNYNGHVWFKRVDKTICIQAGQMEFKLYYAVIDIQDGNVIHMKHSIYGDELWK